MKLLYQQEINRIKNCPLKHKEGQLTLFRIVENPISVESFQPEAVLQKPKYQNLCIAWGLSLFSKKKTAQMMLKGLSQKKRPQYAAIAESVIGDQDGIKNCGKDRRHYTFFPRVGYDFLRNFKVTQ